MIRALLGALLLAGLPAGAVLAQALQPVPPLQARVTDTTGTLTAAQQAELEGKLAAFEQRKGAQIALLVVATTQPEAIEQYSIRVADAWKLGREKSDDGALLLVALQDRALRIEVGRGLEGALPDATANRILDETIKPLFRQGDIYAGVRIAAGVRQPTASSTWCLSCSSAYWWWAASCARYWGARWGRWPPAAWRAASSGCCRR
jgi:uncharacterized protein